MTHQKGSHRARLSYRCIVTAIALAFAAPVHAELIEPVPAIWRVQQLEFDYHSARARYSCDGLKNKIRSILRAVGVHPSLVVGTRCNSSEPVSSARVSIALAAPVEATEENVRAATSFQPHEVLAARLRHAALPTAGNLERFAASWQRVSLAPLQLRSGDCDLLNDLRGQVFPKLRIRRVTGFSCVVAATRLRPVPHVEALIDARVEDSVGFRPKAGPAGR